MSFFRWQNVAPVVPRSRCRPWSRDARASREASYSLSSLLFLEIRLVLDRATSVAELVGRVDFPRDVLVREEEVALLLKKHAREVEMSKHDNKVFNVSLARREQTTSHLKNLKLQTRVLQEQFASKRRPRSSTSSFKNGHDANAAQVATEGEETKPPVFAGLGKFSNGTDGGKCLQSSATAPKRDEHRFRLD
jgi:hypothetical protein